jgi:uncharacterized membrane protein
MSHSTITTAAGLLLVLLVAGISLNPASASATPAPYILSTSIVVTADGDAAISQTLVMPQNTTSVTIPLLSAQVGDILSVDQAGAPASYEITGTNITIYTLGATSIDLSYFTSALTTKQGSIWTVDFTLAANSTLELPAQSTILSFSSAPLSVTSLNGVPVLLLDPGAWEVSYGLPIETSQSQTSSSTVSGSTVSSSSAESTSGASSSASSSVTSNASSSMTSTSGSSSTVTPELVVVLLAAVVLAGASAFLVLRRRGRSVADPSALRPDDIEMLRFIRDRGGKVVEAEIRERFSVPRTTAWRQAKRLEQLGYLRVSKLGSQNQLELIRNDFE